MSKMQTRVMCRPSYLSPFAPRSRADRPSLCPLQRRCRGDDTDVAQRLLQSVERRQDLKRLAGRASVVARLPVNGFFGTDHSPDDELTVARTRELFAQPRDLCAPQILEDGRRCLVVFVLEPAESLRP